MKAFHEFIYDESQIEKFHSLLSPLKEHESYFLSMSARNKYLTEEERQHYELGRTEMFARKLVKRSEFETFLRVLKSMQVSRGGYTSRKGVELPDRCLLVYANINPVNGIKALKEFQEKTTQMMFDMVDGADVKKKFASLDTEMMNCYQRAKGTRTLIDVDFDVPDDGIDLVEKVLADLRKHEVAYHVIKTRSGFHVLLEKAGIRYNYTEVIKTANDEAVDRYSHAEVVVNKNDMIPVPGTMQADHSVCFVNM